MTRVHWRLWGRARLGMFLRLKELRIMAYRCHAPLIFTYQDWLALSEPILGVFFYISSSGNSGSIWYIRSLLQYQCKSGPYLKYTILIVCSPDLHDTVEVILLYCTMQCLTKNIQHTAIPHNTSNNMQNGETYCRFSCF